MQEQQQQQQRLISVRREEAANYEIRLPQEWTYWQKKAQISPKEFEEIWNSLFWLFWQKMKLKNVFGLVFRFK